MRWFTPHPVVSAKFVGLENELVKPYLIDFPKSQFEPVELLDINSRKAKQLLKEFERIRAEFKREKAAASWLKPET